MRRELVELIEAARKLGVQRIPTPDNPRYIRIVGDRKDFPDRLYRVAIALEAVDRLGSKALEGVNDPTLNAAHLRLAVDGIFRWMKATGVDIQEPYQIVAAALGAKGAKRGKIYRNAPKFDANFSKTKKPKPMLQVIPTGDEPTTLAGLRQRAAQAHFTNLSLGAAAPNYGR
ncbi:hypothetical protein ACFOY8_12540 [Thalassospira xianhensis]|uniref:Uncharacterized protein n=2 Tax=Thalassospira TaxID=168934 RepID=A0A285TY09_9PROT|nr:MULTISPECIES: hypothetical protein [Thalassospira]RCK06308.1 hypothetical protein TH5_08890 [Thalassospira xianhensis MCCC 1A02616]SOC27486.1 hypothetical protein SAMN05428964_105435 [Thalassospira xiamenensis]